jgi:hypothetical protein
MELTWFPSSSQKTTSALQTVGPFRLGCNANKQVLVQKIVNIKP